MNTVLQSRSSNSHNCSEEEWAVREDLANCYHLIDYMGWSETIFNHISARVPGPENHYLVNPFGLLYTEVTPENLLKVDLQGEKVDPSPYDANPAGFALHSAIHGARSDIHCVIHTHTTQVAAIAQKTHGFSHNDFYGAQIFGRVSYHTFEGITLFADEKERMLRVYRISMCWCCVITVSRLARVRLQRRFFCSGRSSARRRSSARPIP